MFKKSHSMSLKTRLMLLSTVWLIFILLGFNVFTYFFVLHITTKSEIQLLWKKAETILSDPGVHNPSHWKDQSLLSDNLVSNEIIRIIDKNGSVIVQIYSDDQLLKHEAHFRDMFHYEVVNTGESRMIFVQDPLVINGETVATLEIGRVMYLLDDYLSILVTALTITTIGAIVLSLAGGYFYSRFLFQPITQLADTMKAIQDSGVFRRLDMGEFSKSDELWKLGITFNRMMDALEEHFFKQKRFIEDASHEMRTPLTIIESYSNLLKRWGSEQPEVREEALEAIHSEAIRMKNLVAALMAVIESDDARETEEWAKVDLVKICRTSVRSMRLSFQRSIEFKTNAAAIYVEGDAEKLKQLLIILLDNALKYSRKSIRVNLHKEEDNVTLSVTDLGIGIPAEQIPMLFDRFYRADKARSRKTGGFGLGLAIADNIVRRHGGSLRVKSRLHQGTKVEVSLPLKRPAHKKRPSSEE